MMCVIRSGSRWMDECGRPEEGSRPPLPMCFLLVCFSFFWPLVISHSYSVHLRGQNCAFRAKDVWEAIPQRVAVSDSHP